MSTGRETQFFTPPVARACVAAFVAAVVMYFVTFSPFAPAGETFGFVNYDDPSLVSVANPAIGKGLGPGMSELIDPTTPRQFMNAWLPLYYGSLAIDFHLFGDAAWGYHLHSTLLHALAALLVALLAWRLGVRPLGAAAAGIIFAVHPAATESVAWIASRKDQLAIIWMIFSSLLYLRAIRIGRSSLHGWGALCLAVSMTAKGTTLVLPLLLAAHAVLVRRSDDGPVKGRLAAVVPYGLVAIVMTALHLWVALNERTVGGEGAATTGSIVLADLEVVWKYVALLLVPVHQSVEHGVHPLSPDVVNASFGAVAVLVWLVAIAATLFRKPAACAVLVAIPLALAPFNNVFPRTTTLFAERYVYVALLPFAIGLGALLTQRVKGGRGIFPLIAVVGLLVTGTWLRLPVWRNSVELWEDAVRKAPESPVPRLQLAQAYQERAAGLRTPDGNDPPERLEFDRLAENAWLEAEPRSRTELDRGRAMKGYGIQLFVTAGDVPDPRTRLEHAVEMLERAENALVRDLAADAPRDELYAVYANRAEARKLLGDTEGALDDWSAAVKVDEGNATAWANLAWGYGLAGRADEAAKALNRSRQIEPAEPGLVLDRVRVHLSLGDAAAAKSELRHAMRTHPNDARCFLEAGRLDRKLGRPVDAVGHFRSAFRILGEPQEIRTLLATTLLEQAEAQAVRLELDDARKAAREAMRLEPDSFVPYQILGIVERKAGDLVEATRNLRRASEIHPGGKRIRRALASLLAERAAVDLGAGSEGTAMLRLEEAVGLGADVLATPAGRVELSVTRWPPPPPEGDERGVVARMAALRGLAWLAAAEHRKAVTELEVAVAGATGHDESLLRVSLDMLVRARFGAGLDDSAMQAALELAALGPGGDDEPFRPDARLSRTYTERGMVRRTAGDTAGAREDFATAHNLLKTAASKGMGEARVHLSRGEILFAEEKYLDATREFDESVRLDDRDPDAYLDLAAVWRTKYVLDEDETYLEGAEDDLRRALALAPGDPRVLTALGETLLMLERRSQAYPVLMRAVLADPSQRGARAMLANLMIHGGRSALEKGRIEQAQAVADRALALDPPTPDALVFQGDVYRAQKEWRRAEETYEQARDRFPERLEPLDALVTFYCDAGHGYLIQGRKARAVDAFHTALALEREGVDVSVPRDRLHALSRKLVGDAVALHRAGDLVGAEKSLRLALRSERRADTWFNLGLVLGDQEAFVEAVVAYGEVLELEPDHAGALLNRAGMYLRQGRLDEAEADYLGWKRVVPADHPEQGRVANQIDWIRKLRAELEASEPGPRAPR